MKNLIVTFLDYTIKCFECELISGYATCSGITLIVYSSKKDEHIDIDHVRSFTFLEKEG